MLEKYIEAVEKNKALIQETERWLWEHPEIGYKEWKGSEYLKEKYVELGYQIVEAGDIPGFTAELDTGKEGPTIAFMAELDSLMCETHPEADPVTKAVHACGHHGQQAGIIGCAAALKEPGVLDELSGKIRFVIVPAEETIDLEFRQSLIKQGIIKYVAGKIEFLRRGLLDGIDMAVLIHLDTKEGKLFEILEGNNGCITKHFEYQGVASHAGVAPEKGVNALYAASLGMMACNSLRETFEEKDYVRYHPIITQAGVAANAIPDVAKMDTYVRASSFAKMKEINKKINRALGASAAALGANVRIQDTVGNMPMEASEDLNQVFVECVDEIFGPNQIRNGGWNPASTDLGDISMIMPAIQPMVIGASGLIHGQDFQVSDPVKACVNPAKVMTAMAYVLLKDDAKRGKELIKNFQPVFASKEEYFSAVEEMRRDFLAVEYTENDEARLVY